MGSYDIPGVGTATVDKKDFECQFTISADKFMEKYASLAENLSNDVRSDVRKAIETKKRQKVRDRDALENLFSQATQQTSGSARGAAAGAGAASGAAAGAGAASGAATGSATGSRGTSRADREEAKDRAAGEAAKSGDVEPDSEMKYGKKNENGNYNTIDKKSGKKEGEITLGSQGATGLVVPVELIEKIEAHYEFNAETPKDDPEAKKITGQFKIKNPSTKDRIWDVDVAFKKDGAKGSDLPNTISIKNLEPEKEEVKEYKIDEFQDPILKVKEFISTMNKEDVETYALSTSESNVVLFKVTLTNSAEVAVSNITVKKEIQDGYKDATIGNTSIGEAKIDGNAILWTIEKLEPKAEATVSINMTINIAGADVKARSGKVTVEYKAENTVTGLGIAKFDAYTNNFVGIDEDQQDDDPDTYMCSVVFQNKSEFRVKLIDLDIVDPETKKKVLDIDPGEIPDLAAGAQWKSVPWISKTTDGMEPAFHKTVEFFVLADMDISTLGTISIDDIELAVALMSGQVQFSKKQLPSFKVEPFDAVLHVKNTGGADLNDLIIEQIVQPGFMPPKSDQIELYVVRPPENQETGKITDDELKVDWEKPDLGEQITVEPNLIEITPNDQESTVEHTIRIKLENLRDNAIGMFLPGMIIRAKYPLTANKVAKDTEFVSKIKYIGNTFPAGAPIEVIPAEVKILIAHIRKKAIKGKTIRALPEEGQYEIILSVNNTSEFEMPDVDVRDAVPEHFEYSDLTIEAKTDSLEGRDVLAWKIDKIEPKGSVEIKYKIKGTGDYKASESQFSL